MIGFTGTSLQLNSIILALTFNTFLKTSIWRISYEESLTELNARINSLLYVRENRTEITFSKGYITLLHECVFSEIGC
jgi:hypothetical protein